MTLKQISAVFLILTVLMTVSGCGTKASEEELRNRAQDFEKEEKFQEALATYQELLENYPRGKYADETVQKIAYLYYNNFNDFDKAIEYHERLVRDYTDSKFVSKARFMIGYIYANNLHDYDSAEGAYHEFLEHHPNDELAESVKWELKHLGQDINEQLKDLFGKESNGQTQSDAQVK